nr:protein BUD31 homolog 2 [Ipomoea batatas]
MPKVKTNRVRYPKGWELIEPTLNELQAKMREAENDPHDGKRKCEALWPIFKICHQKSRYIFDLYHRRKEISKELYEFCLDQGYADRNLIAKWKKREQHAQEVYATQHDERVLHSDPGRVPCLRLLRVRGLSSVQESECSDYRSGLAGGRGYAVAGGAQPGGEDLSRDDESCGVWAEIGEEES